MIMMMKKCIFASALLLTLCNLQACTTSKEFQEAMARKEQKESATGSNIAKGGKGDAIVVSPDAFGDKRNNPSAPKTSG